VAFALGRRIGASEDACVRGISSVRWPGRLETLETKEGPVLLDAAHNPDGAVALAHHLETLGKDVTLVFGTLADKAWEEMIDVLAPHAARRVYAAPRGRAATSAEAIAARHPGEVAASVGEAYERARAAAGKGLVVACGSIALIGELRARLLGLPRDPPIAL
jgi:dihydrofolate synthase/folylpolyglutamate synthase